MLQELRARGFDIAQPFAAHAITTPGWEHLARGPRYGLLVGNTRALWPLFTAAREPGAHPLDAYVERAIGEVIGDAEVVFAHRAYAGAFLPFQHLAVAIGLGALSEGHLVVHPTYGPWFALRAVITLDAEPPPIAAPIAKPCACTTCPAALSAALADAGNWRAWLAVRDACHLREHRYSDEQIRFHYAGAWASE